MTPVELHEMPLTLAPPGPAYDADEFPYPPQDLPVEDGINLESNWHRIQISLLVDMIEWHRRDRQDFFAGGNMFVHYSEEQVRNKDFRGPDFLLVNNTTHNQDRLYWATWKEGGRYPDLIVELMSPTTRDVDLTTKFEIYEKTFSTREYVAYDPNTRQILAWRKVGGEFQPIAANERGHYFLEIPGLWLGVWYGKHQGEDGNWIRFFDETGNVVFTRGEAESGNAKAALEFAAQEKARADALADEVARLNAELAIRSDGAR